MTPQNARQVSEVRAVRTTSRRAARTLAEAIARGDRQTAEVVHDLWQRVTAAESAVARPREE